jgi:hypothetical protein
MTFGLVFALAALIFLVTALGAAGDPVDVSQAPTEDWLFDEGKETEIKSETWTVRYNITIVNGSTLKIAVCNWTFNSTDPFNPVGIILIDGYLELNQTDMHSDEGTPGYYIESHDFLKINGGTFTDFGSNPTTGAGISIILSEADISFMEINGTESAHAIYAKNSNITLYECTITDIGGYGIFLDDSNNQYYQNYTCELIYVDIYDIDGYGIYLRAFENHGNATIDALFVEIYDTRSYGIYIDVGPHYSNNDGDGNVFATFNHTFIHHTSSYGMYLYHYYQRSAGVGMNIFDLDFINSEISNTSSYGIYSYMYRTYVDFNVSMDNFTLRDIPNNYGWYMYNYGYQTKITGTLYAMNTAIIDCGYYGIYCYGYYGGFTNGVSFINSEFRGMTNYGMYMNYYYWAPSHIIFDNTLIADNGQYGMYFYTFRSNSRPIQVINSTVRGNGAAGLYFYSSTDAKGIGFNVTGSLFEHQTGPAIWLRPYYLDGPTVLNFIDCRLNDTGGIKFETNYGPYNNAGSLDVHIYNTTIENSTGKAVDIKTSVYRSGLFADILIENSTITDAHGDGIVVQTGVYSTYRPASNADVRVMNVTLLRIKGTAMNFIDLDPSLSGSRSYWIEATTVESAQRGIFMIGMSGEVWNSKFIDILKEDALILASRTRLYYNEYNSINERKFRALSGGEITFIFDLQITVQWNTGAPAIGANVKIMDNKQKLISVQTVRSEDGSLPVLTLEPHTVREIGIFSQAPYVVNVTFLEITRTTGVRLERNEEVIIIIEDNTEPEIFILYPKEGHVQQTTTLEVRGSAWDAQSGIRTVELSLDGLNWTEAQGSWLKWNVTLIVTDEQIRESGGLFNLRAKASDFALNDRVASVIIRVDPTPPELNVDFPQNGFRTNSPDLWVRGVTEVGSQIKINGVPADVVVSMFNHKVTLFEGQNSISVVSIDPLGNIMIVQLTVHLDTQNPFFILISPEEDEMTNEEELIVVAQVEDDLKISVNGQSVPYRSPGYPEGEGTFECPVTLTAGQNPLTILVEDLAGNVNLIERVITLDRTPPWINVFSPKDGDAISRPEVTITGTVEPSARLFVQDEDVTVRNGYFERVILALEGPNNVTLVAFDEAGNQYVETIVIYIDTVDPVMAITEPVEDNVIVTESRFIITGVIEMDEAGELSGTTILLNGDDNTIIDDGEGMTRVMIQANPDGTFSIPVDLEEGRNELTIEVMDAVGNRVSVTKTVFLDTRAPTLVIYLDPIKVEEDGGFSTQSLILNLTGYTDPGSDLRVLDILLGVDENGRFSMNVDLVPKDDTTIIVTSTDMAGNIRVLEETISQKTGPTDGDESDDTGMTFLLIALVLFILIAIITIYFVRTQRDHYVEMEIAHSTPVADLEDLDADLELEVDDVGGEEGAEEEVSATPAHPRPRPHPRRAAAPRPVRAPVPKMDDKELSDQGAEADIVADETEQEGD